MYASSASTFLILATLSAGILIGSVAVRGVHGKQAQVDSSDATPLKIPDPGQPVDKFHPDCQGSWTGCCQYQQSRRCLTEGQSSCHCRIMATAPTPTPPAVAATTTTVRTKETRDRDRGPTRTSRTFLTTSSGRFPGGGGDQGGSGARSPGFRLYCRSAWLHHHE